MMEHAVSQDCMDNSTVNLLGNGMVLLAASDLSKSFFPGEMQSRALEGSHILDSQCCDRPIEYPNIIKKIL